MISSSLLASSLVAKNPGSSISQIFEFSGDKRIDKISLDLTVINKNRKEFFIGKDGYVSFPASNFQQYQDSWIFQPVNHVGLWETSSNTIGLLASQDISEYSSSNPILGYNFYLDQAGNYNLWGYGYTVDNAVYWSWDKGEYSELTLNTISFEPKWVNFGNIYVSEPGIYSFNITSQRSGKVLLDQWCFTKSDMSENSTSIPWEMSSGPFMTALRLSSISGNFPYNNEIVSWLPSVEINASGKFNYLIKEKSDSIGKYYSNGVSIEFWQIGGSEDFCAGWNYSFVSDDDSVGPAYSFQDYKTSYTNVSDL